MHLLGRRSPGSLKINEDALAFLERFKSDHLFQMNDNADVSRHLRSNVVQPNRFHRAVKGSRVNISFEVFGSSHFLEVDHNIVLGNSKNIKIHLCRTRQDDSRPVIDLFEIHTGQHARAALVKGFKVSHDDHQFIPEPIDTIPRQFGHRCIKDQPGLFGMPPNAYLFEVGCLDIHGVF